MASSTSSTGSMGSPPPGVHTTSSPPSGSPPAAPAAVPSEEPSNKGMEAKDWPRGPSDPAVSGTSEAGSSPDTSKRGQGEEGQQYAQPDQSGFDPKAKPVNPGHDMMKAREKAEAEKAKKGG